MKSVYIAFIPLESGSGISRKIQAQYDAFLHNGLDMDFCVPTIIDDNYCYTINNSIIDNLGKGKLSSIKSFYKYNKILDYIKSKNVKFVYIRYDIMKVAPPFLSFLKRIKSLGATIYMEIPTYPYDGELPSNKLKYRIRNYIEKNTRKYYYKYIDKIVTFSNDSQIFNIDTIQISNAVDSERITPREPLKHAGINLIAVAMFNFWHGYDRLIKGLHDYYSSDYTDDVHLYLVGKGKDNVLEDYQQLVDALNLNEHVTFCGVLYGDELDKMFDIADIGVGSLGRHRNGITHLKALKNVEYAVRGIPFIYSEHNSDFDDKPYVLKVSADDSNLDVNEIVKFYKSIDIKGCEIRKSIINELSWDFQIRKITQSIYSLH